MILLPALPVEMVCSYLDLSVFNVLIIVCNAIMVVVRPVSLDILLTLLVYAYLLASYPVPPVLISNLPIVFPASLQPLSAVAPVWLV